MITYTIYALIDPGDNRPFYVGRTQDCRRRLREHINYAYKLQPKSPQYTPTQCRIQSILENHRRPTMRVLETTTDYNYARGIEGDWMRKIAASYSLTNQIQEGGGIPFWQQSN